MKGENQTRASDRQQGSLTLQEEISELEQGMRELERARGATIEAARRLARYLGQLVPEANSPLSSTGEKGCSTQWGGPPEHNSCAHTRTCTEVSTTYLYTVP